MDFRGVTLSDVDLPMPKFVQYGFVQMVDFSGVNLTGVNLSESYFQGNGFNGTVFSDGTIGANLSNTQGTGANLSSWGGINLEGVNLTGVNLSTQMNFSVSQTTIFSDGVIGANLADASPSGAMANDVDRGS